MLRQRARAQALTPLSLHAQAAVSDHVQIVAGVRLAACSAAMSSIREAGAASLCAEQIYRIREEDSLGRHIILTVYILLNFYMFLEAYFRWVGIVDDQGT